MVVLLTNFRVWMQPSSIPRLARNICLNYESRRPEFSQNGGYAAGFAEWLRAIACHFTADFVMLACCRLNSLMHMPSTHIYPSFYKSCVMLHYSQFSKWPKTSPQPKLKSNKNSQGRDLMRTRSRIQYGRRQMRRVNTVLFLQSILPVVLGIGLKNKIDSRFTFSIN